MTDKPRSLLYLAASAAVVIVLQEACALRGAELQVLSTALAVVPLYFAFRWYALDATERRFRRSPVLNVAIVALWLVAFPYYLFRTRGLWGGLRGTGVFLLLLLAYGLVQVVVGALLKGFGAVPGSK